MDKPDFSAVTEITGNNVTSEQIERMFVRYRFAAKFCRDKEVLEVACGSGQGLGCLAKAAKKVVGGDIDEKNLQLARDHYRDRRNVELKIIDAHCLPFENNTFDVVLLYEAIYYLKDPQKFMQEAMRVLRKGGVLIICSVNKDWVDFNPSPYSFAYFSAPKLFELFKSNGFMDITLYGHCVVRNKSLKDKVISLVKKTAVRLHVIPNTMKGKEVLKRIFFGKLLPLPPEITDEMAQYSSPSLISAGTANTSYKVLFCLGYKQ